MASDAQKAFEKVMRMADRLGNLRIAPIVAVVCATPGELLQLMYPKYVDRVD
jgi:hypothetical protein